MVANSKNSKSTRRLTTKRRARRQLPRPNGSLSWDHLSKKRGSMLRYLRSTKATMNTWKRSRDALQSLWNKSLMLFASRSSLNASKEKDYLRKCIAMLRLSRTSSSRLMRTRLLRTSKSSTKKHQEIIIDTPLLSFLTNMFTCSTGLKLNH